MIEITGIKSITKPIEIDDTSSDTTVYVRYNIKKRIEGDPVFCTDQEVYIYDEKQYSFAEWYSITRKETNDRLLKLEKTLDLILNDLELSIEEE